MHRTVLQPPFRNAVGRQAIPEIHADPATWIRAARPAAAQGRKEIAFVDASLADHAILEAAIRPGVAVVRFGGRCDGLAQLGHAAVMLEACDAIHILCHGEPGRLLLGTRVLDTDALASGADGGAACALAALGGALRAGGELLLYGCSAGAGDEGRRFVAALAQATGAAVAAATGPTGAAAQGGTWSLPVRSGTITTPLALDAAGAAAWPHLMAASITFDLSSGTLRDNTTEDGNVVQTVGGLTMTVSAGDTNDVYIYDTNEYGDLVFSPPSQYIAATNNSVLDIDTFASTPSLQVSFGATVTLNSLDVADFSAQAQGSRIRITSLDGTHTTVVDVPAQSDARVTLGWAGVTGFTVTPESYSADTDYGSNLIPLGIDNIVVTQGGAPTTTVAGAALSYDTGASASDFVTKVASQTVSGTLSAALLAGESVQVSYDGGAHWQNAAVFATGSNTWSDATTLAGSNTFEVRVTNTDGNGTAYTHTYTLDTVAPTTTVGGLSLSRDTGASSTDFVTNDPSQTVTATLSAALGAGDTLYASTDNGATWTDISASVSGTTVSWNTLLATGGNTLAFKVVDLAGNDGAVATQAYTLDTTAPATPTRPAMRALDDSGASGSDAITSVTSPTIGGSAEAYATITLYDTDSNGSTTRIATTSANGSGAWSFNQTLAEGSHSLSVTATDAAGNLSTASSALAVTIDTQAPTAVALGSATTTVAAAVANATVATLSSTDGSAVTYTLVGGNGADNGSFVIAGNTLAIGGSALAAGTYHINVQAVDLAGNATTVAETFTVSDAPSVSSIVRAGGAAAGVPASATSVTYTVTFSDAVTGVDASDFALTATGNAGGAIAAVAATASPSVYTVTVDALAGDGTLRLDLKPAGTGIQSSAGGAIAGGYAAGAVYTLDHSAPAAPPAPALSPLSDSGASGDDITNVVTPIITGSAEAHASVTLYDTDGATVLGTASADGSGHWSIASSTLAGGSHTLSARATDAAGNVSAAGSPLALTIATSAAAPGAPVLASGSDSGIAGDGITKIVTPVVGGHAAAGASVTLYDTDGTTVLGATTADGAGNWSITSSTLANGSHTLTAGQIDVAGNVSPIGAGLALTIDTDAPAAPTAPSLAPASDSGTPGDNSTVSTAPVIRGSGEANALVTLYDTSGTAVLGTATVDGSGSWSVTSSTLAPGSHTITARQTDAAGNVSAASAPLALFIETPVVSTPSTPTVDGVAVTTQAVILPDGGSGTQVTIPLVTGGRVETTGSAGLADIPLATANGATLLLSQLPVGFGLSASGGASQGATAAAQQLIQAITAATPGHTSGDQAHLTGNGSSFLDQLAASTLLLVETIVPTTTATAPADALVLTGTSSATQRTALVIDTTHMAADARIALDQVDFAAIVGAANVTASASGQVLTGDAAAQTFTVAASVAGAVFSGGGDDTLVFSSGAAAAVRAAGTPATLATAYATTILHGGLDSDTAVFSGNRADYAIDAHDSYLVITPLAQPDTHALVIDVETLRFADTSVAVTHGDALGSIAGLYQAMLGRQADYLGIDFWASTQDAGASLGQVALAMLRSPEAQARLGDTLNGNAAHDVDLLYQAILGRHGDAAGLSYWTDALAHGAGLDAVAQAMVVGLEGQQHTLGALQWDFLV